MIGNSCYATSDFAFRLKNIISTIFNFNIDLDIYFKDALTILKGVHQDNPKSFPFTNPSI